MTQLALIYFIAAILDLTITVVGLENGFTEANGFMALFVAIPKERQVLTS